MVSEVDRAFSAGVLDGLKTTPFGRIAVPAGKSVIAAWDALSESAGGRGLAAFQLVINDDWATESGFFLDLSDHLGDPNCPENLEGFLIAMADWYQPRLVVLTGKGAGDKLFQILGHARRLANATRDARAPIRFVWMHDASQVPLGRDIPYEVWPSQWRDIPQVDFIGTRDTVLYRAFRVYLDRKLYWEAAGQEDRLNALAERILSHSLSHNSPNLDSILDHLFDTAPIPDAERLFAADCLAEPKQQDALVAAMNQQACPQMDSEITKLWHTAGILWRPPGISRWQLTTMSVRILIDSPEHPLAQRLGKPFLQRKIEQARANTQVAQMALLLTTQVESELLDALRWHAPWERLVTQCGLDADLNRLRARSVRKPMLATKTDGCLLDWASFGQLVRIAESAGRDFRFPLSRERLGQIADVRNDAAHRRPVGWTGLSVVLDALITLGT